MAGGGERWGVSKVAGSQAGRCGGSLRWALDSPAPSPPNDTTCTPCAHTKPPCNAAAPTACAITHHPAAAPTWMNCCILYVGNGTWAGSLCTCSKQRAAQQSRAELRTPIRAGRPTLAPGNLRRRQPDSLGQLAGQVGSSSHLHAAPWLHHQLLNKVDAVCNAQQQQTVPPAPQKDEDEA